MVCHHAPFCATLTDILLTINIKTKQTTTKETKVLGSHVLQTPRLS